MQVVREPVPGCERPVRPPLLAGRLDEPSGAREGVAARFDLGLGERGRGRGGGGRELLSDRARGGEKLAVDRVELLEHLLDQLRGPCPVRHSTGGRGRARLRPAGRCSSQESSRVVTNSGLPPVRSQSTADTSGDAAEPSRAVRWSPTAFRLSGPTAISVHRPRARRSRARRWTRMLLRDGVAAPVRTDDEQTRRLPSSGERIEEVDGRGIAPVQVLEDEDERELVADRLEGLEHLPEHPQGRGSDQAALNAPRARRRRGATASVRARSVPAGRAAGRAAGRSAGGRAGRAPPARAGTALPRHGARRTGRERRASAPPTRLARPGSRRRSSCRSPLRR